MIIYGSRGTHFSTQDLSGAVCPYCHKYGTLQVSLVSRYAHVYWIPLFPFQKVTVVQCAACHMSWEDKATPPELAEEVRAAKAQVHHPWWTWAGLLLLALAIGYGAFSSARNTRTDDSLLESPRAGDIYTVRSDSAHQYSLLKVRQVSGNSIELVANEYQTESETPINVINEPAKYSTEPFIITRLDLRIMRRQGKLTDVDRP